jgi:hypothetical protein
MSPPQLLPARWRDTRHMAACVPLFGCGRHRMRGVRKSGSLKKHASLKKQFSSKRHSDEHAHALDRCGRQAGTQAGCASQLRRQLSAGCHPAAAAGGRHSAASCQHLPVLHRLHTHSREWPVGAAHYEMLSYAGRGAHAVVRAHPVCVLQFAAASASAAR